MQPILLVSFFNILFQHILGVLICVIVFSLFFVIGSAVEKKFRVLTFASQGKLNSDPAEEKQSLVVALLIIKSFNDIK